MTKEEFLNEVSDQLGCERNTLKLSDTPSTVDDWDSIGHLSILSMIEDKLSIPVDSKEMQNFKSLQELFDRLVALGAIDE